DPKQEPKPKPTASAAKGDDAKKDDSKPGEKEPPKKPVPPKVVIHFDGLYERVHRLRIPESTESNLVWSPDGKKLAFAATVEGKRGMYLVEFPDQLTPKLITTTAMNDVAWLKAGNVIVGLAAGVPSSVAGAAAAAPTGATPTAYRFSAQQT